MSNRGWSFNTNNNSCTPHGNRGQAIATSNTHDTDSATPSPTVTFGEGDKDEYLILGIKKEKGSDEVIETGWCREIEDPDGEMHIVPLFDCDHTAAWNRVWDHQTFENNGYYTQVKVDPFPFFGTLIQILLLLIIGGLFPLMDDAAIAACEVVRVHPASRWKVGMRGRLVLRRGESGLRWGSWPRIILTLDDGNPIPPRTARSREKHRYGYCLYPWLTAIFTLVVTNLKPHVEANWTNFFHGQNHNLPTVLGNGNGGDDDDDENGDNSGGCSATAASKRKFSIQVRSYSGNDFSVEVKVNTAVDDLVKIVKSRSQTEDAVVLHRPGANAEPEILDGNCTTALGLTGVTVNSTLFLVDGDVPFLTHFIQGKTPEVISRQTTDARAHKIATLFERENTIVSEVITAGVGMKKYPFLVKGEPTYALVTYFVAMCIES